MSAGFHPAVDPEFKALIPPLLAEERQQLESNLLAEGCRDPLVVWQEKGLLLDGHNRLSICKESGIDYQVQRLSFLSREQATNWIINNQLGRRNLHPDQASYLRGKRYNLEKAKVPNPEGAGGKSGKIVGRQNGDQQKTHERLAEEYKVSPKTIERDGKYTAAVDTLTDAGIDPANVIAKENKSAVVEFANEIKPQDDEPETPLIPREPKQQDPVVAEVTEKVKRGEMSILDASKEIRAAKAKERRTERTERINTIASGNADMDTSKRYPVIYADPPWRYDHASSDNRAIENQYPTMSIEELCELPVSDLAAQDAVLFLWATSPKLLESLRLVESWGFTYRTCAVWDKQKIGMGYYFRQQHELLLVATRGDIPAPAPEARPTWSVLSESRGAHSSKPDKFAETIEAMYPEFDKIELFCRSPRNGWSVWGNQSHAA